MARIITFFPEHADFVAGKTKLHWGLFFNRSLIMAVMLLVSSILFVIAILLILIGEMLNGTVYLPAMYITGFIAFILGVFFILGMPYRKYRRLQDGASVIEAVITNTGIQTTGGRSSGYGRNPLIVYFADYAFYNPNKQVIQNRAISGRSSYYFNVGDKFLILYADDKNYVVL